MDHIEFLQKGLADAANNLVNAESALQRYCRILANAKCLVIGKKLIGKDFKAIDIVDRTSWETDGIKLDAMMRATIVNADLQSCYSVSVVYEGPTMIKLTVTFQRDPDELLKSRARLTDAEKDILKEMRGYYRLEYAQPDDKTVKELNRKLKKLKHNYNMVCRLTWNYSFNDIINSGFLTNGICTNKIRFV